MICRQRILLSPASESLICFDKLTAIPTLSQAFCNSGPKVMVLHLSCMSIIFFLKNVMTPGCGKGRAFVAVAGLRPSVELLL